LLCLLPRPLGDKPVKIAVAEHDALALFAATDVHVTKLATADEAAKRSD
jgi:hypothetical protein